MSRFGNWLKSFFKGIDSGLTRLSDKFWHNNTFGKGLANMYHNVPMEDILTGAVNSFTGAGLTPAQREANEFTAAEAQKTRDWQEHMRATNFQAQVGDMQAAGLNPALMYANGGSSSTPSGPSASSVAPSAPASLQEVLAAVKLKKELKILDAQKDNIDSQTGVNKITEQKIGAEIPKIGAETDLLTKQKEFVQLQMDYYPSLTDAQINKINKEVDVLTAQIPLLNAQTKEADSVAALNRSVKLLKDKEYQWYDTLRQADYDKIIADTDLAVFNKWISAYRAQYMQTYGTDVPSSGWAAFISAMMYNVNGALFFDQVLEKFGKALGNALSRIPETSVNIEQNQQTNTTPGSVHNPYYPSN